MPVSLPAGLSTLHTVWRTGLQTPVWPAVLVLIVALVLAGCGGSSGSEALSDTPGMGNGDNAQLDASQCTQTIASIRLDAPVTLVNSASPCDYYLSGAITLSSAVTIEPGTVFLAALGTSLFLDSGQLTAVGTADAPIVFRGESSLPGYWSGINLASLRPSRLEHVQIHDAGDNSPGNGVAGLRVSLSTIAIEDVTVSNSYVHGVSLHETTRLTSFARNRFVGNALSGLVIPKHLIGQLDTASDYRGIEAENGDPVVTLGISFEDLVDATWPAINAPYRITYLSIGQDETLTLAPGVRLAMASDATLSVLDGGYLRAEGTADRPVELARAPGAIERWDTLEINGGAVALRHARLTGAQNAITLDERGTLDVSATAFEDYANAGILCDSLFFNAVFDADKLRIGNAVSFDGSGNAMRSERCPGSP